MVPTECVIDLAPSPLLVRVLGPLDILAGGRVTTLGSARQRELLAVLVVHAGQVVATDTLIDVLWGDVPPPSAAHTVQGLVSRLRSVLGGTAIVAQAPGYLLSASTATIDSQVFEDLVTQARNAARAGEADAAIELFDAALALWRGGAFGEFGDRPFAQAEVSRIQELRDAVIEDRADVLLASGPPSELVGDLEAAARAAPYRERRQGQLMTALARSGRPVEAMRSYERFRRRLTDEVGVVPSRSLQRGASASCSRWRPKSRPISCVSAWAMARMTPPLGAGPR
jgi:DNA-binding SARP family transcriptional activator